VPSFKLKSSWVTILQGVEFSIFPLILAWALQQCSATALPVIQSWSNKTCDKNANKLRFLHLLLVISWAGTLVRNSWKQSSRMLWSPDAEYHHSLQSSRTPPAVRKSLGCHMNFFRRKMQNSHAESATTPRMPDSSHKKFFNQSLRPKFNSGKLIKKAC